MFPHLFSEIGIGKRVARNRTMRTATTSNLAEKFQVTPRQIDFYRRLAQGGVGVIVTESVAVHPSYTAGGGTLQMYDRASLPGFRLLTAAVREEGALFICQLRHGGRQHHARQTPTLWAPSAIPCPHSGTTPHEMTAEQVREVVEGFVNSAKIAEEAGFHGVEIQGGNGHLIQEFLSGFTNRRSDRYGGDADKRMTFAREIVAEVRAAVSPDFIVGYRLALDEFAPGGITLEDSIRTAVEFSASGKIDYIVQTQGTFYSIETHLPDRRFAPNAYVASHDAAVKKAVAAVSGIPVVASGRIRRPDDAEVILASGQADMIGMCRQLLADPDWPNKARDGHPELIRLCTNGNHCWGRIRSGDPIACEINSELGREAEYRSASAPSTAKRVVVVGAGPAGLEAARVAALRGHSVLVVERESAIGGRLGEAPDMPGYSELHDFVRYLSNNLGQQGVEIRLGAEATADSIADQRPDEVVIATGAASFVPEMRTDGSVRLASRVVDLPPATGPKANAVLFDEDGDTWAVAETERLARLGYRTTVVTRSFEPFRDLPIVSRITSLKVLDDLGVELIPNSEIEAVAEGEVLLRHAYSGRSRSITDAAVLVWIGRLAARDSLAFELRERGLTTHVIGDAFAPRRLVNAVHEGNRVGRQI